jgi:hypothetical protein
VTRRETDDAPMSELAPANWPHGLEPSMSRAAVRERLGTPHRSGEPGGVGVMALEFAWDQFRQADDSLLRVEYGTADTSIRSVTAMPPEAPEPFMVELDVYADYYQFYVQDLESPCDTAVIWDDPAATEHGFAVGEGLVAITTKRYETVPVRVEVYPKDPGFQWEGIDRVNEGGIVVTTQLGVGMPISASPLPVVDGVAPGAYGVRSISSRFDTVVDDSNGADLYIVQLWPVAELPGVRYLTRPGKGSRKPDRKQRPAR